MPQPLFDAPSLALISNDKYPVSGTVFNPCPPEEMVAFEGFMHQVVTGEQTATSFDLKIHTNTQGIAGIGLTSGDRYRVIRNSKEDFVASFSPLLVDIEFDLRSRLVRQGSNDNFYLRQTFRISFPPFQREVIREKIECRG